jgi:(2R)-ethylmalonyl-CoA mutase
MVSSHMKRMRAIESKELKIVGLNCFTETEPSPLMSKEDGGIMKVDPRAAQAQIESLNAFKAQRNQADVDAALAALKDAANNGDNIMPASIRCAHAGVTTGEWSQTLRDIFGEYRPPTGIDISTEGQKHSDIVLTIRDRVRQTGEELGRPLRMLVGKPGLDGHSNGAEQIAVKARDVGFEIVYEGIRLTPQQITKAALEEGVHLIGLSVLSGSHLELAEDIFDELGKVNLTHIPIIIGGIIPVDDEQKLLARGVAAVYTPKNIMDMNAIMMDIVDIIRESNGLKPFQQKAA